MKRSLIDRLTVAISRLLWLTALAWGCAFSFGCAAFHPIQGLPARYLPEEFRGVSRAGKRTIDLSLLKQTPPAHYLLDSGDTLAVYIEGVLGDRQQPLPPPVAVPVGPDVAPSFGFPIPVRDDGTISLPLIGSLNVRGKTITEVEALLKQAYTVDRQFLNANNDRILVSLQRPRQYRVLVIRQETTTQQNFAAIGQLNLGTMKRGTGKVVSLPAYKNDVLHALAETGGLPGLDAENAVYIIRRRKTAEGWTPAPRSALPAPLTPMPPAGEARSASRKRTIIRAQAPQNVSPQTPPPINSAQAGVAGPALPRPADVISAQFSPPVASPPPAVNAAPELAPPVEAVPSPDPDVTMTPEQFGWDLSDPDFNERRIVRVPIRLGPGETVDLQEQDIILEDGDIVFIESRDTEVFYTGGLLGGGQFTLPRDYDLNVLQAIAVAQGQRVGAIGGASRGTMSLGGQSALNSDVSISASRVVILRYLDDSRMVPIEIDLYKARTDVAEQVIIQPGDYILLQYTKLEAICAFFERHLLEGALFTVAATRFNNN